MANANIYIDGFNLHYGAVKNTPYRWLDLLKLCRLMLPGDIIQEIKYFTARVSSRPHDPDAPTRRQIYLRALRTLPNLKIYYGHFLTHPSHMVLTGSNPVQQVWVDKTEEKGSDVNLATYLLRDAYNHTFDVAVLVTNDSDLVEPVKIVRKELGLSVRILNPHRGRHSQQLQQFAVFIKRIRQADVAACQFPPILTDGKGTFHKPPTW